MLTWINFLYIIRLHHLDYTFASHLLAYSFTSFNEEDSKRFINITLAIYDLSVLEIMQRESIFVMLNTIDKLHFSGKRAI